MGPTNTTIPRSVAFVDVETTGLHSTDRVVSLGAILLDTSTIGRDRLEMEALHLIFDPEKKSHPRAEAVHGHTDWSLRHQSPFPECASHISSLLGRADLLVAHNASFDRAFIERELELADTPAPRADYFCTMLEYRRTRTGRANLNAVLAEMGLRRASEKHGAFEDAWMAMLVYLWLHGRSYRQPPPREMLAPTNYIQPPPMPDGPLPRRRRRVKAAPVAPVVPVPVAASTPPPTRTRSGLPMTAVMRGVLLEAMLPTATMMMAVAAADENVSEAEVSALSLLAIETVRRLGFPVDFAGLQDVVGDLAELEISQAALDASARAIIADPVARQELGGWIREVTYSDGSGSEAEQAAIESVIGALRRARS